MGNLDLLVSLYEQNRSEVNRIPMENYMRNHFPFLGIKTPLRRELMKKFYAETGILKSDFQPEIVELLWDKAEREYQYAALDYIGKFLKKIEASHFTLFEKLIITKSWWDTVDTIAPHAIGTLAKKFPNEIHPKIEEWVLADNLWLNRSAILFQLRYKENTDEDKLFRYILANSKSNEFFIQKAIGWALREYSKTNPQTVKKFIEANSLPKLSVREGSKYI